MKKTDQRTRLTHLLLRKALTELLQQKPLQSITIKELCTAAGLNRSTFYAHYTDLHDLLGQMEAEMLETFCAALQPLLTQSPDELSPVQITTEIFQCLKENADLCAITLGPYGDKKFALRLLDMARECSLHSYAVYFEGASPEQIDYYFSFVSAGCIGLLEKWLSSDMRADPAQIAQIADSIMRHGIHFLHQPEQEP